MAGAIYAHHAHVFPAAVKPEGTIDQLLRLMDACGMEGAVCFPPLPPQALDLDTNQWLSAEIAGRPRLRGFGVIDFARPDLPGQVRRIAELGLRGIKLHPNIQQFAINCPQAMEVYGAAQEIGLFLSFHTGIHHFDLRKTSLLHFDELARTFPRLRFSLEHMGGYHFFNEALAVLANHFPPPWLEYKCRIFAGLASVFTQHYNRFWYIRPDQIMEIIAQSSVEQVIFGLDFPYYQEKEIRIALQTIAQLPVDEPARAKILGLNLQREIGW